MNYLEFKLPVEFLTRHLGICKYIGTCVYQDLFSFSNYNDTRDVLDKNKL